VGEGFYYFVEIKGHDGLGLYRDGTKYISVFRDIQI